MHEQWNTLMDRVAAMYNEIADLSERVEETDNDVLTMSAKIDYIYDAVARIAERTTPVPVSAGVSGTTPRAILVESAHPHTFITEVNEALEKEPNARVAHFQWALTPAGTTYYAALIISES
jgi:seryl-tRNA synthetase